MSQVIKLFRYPQTQHILAFLLYDLPLTEAQRDLPLGPCSTLLPMAHSGPPSTEDIYTQLFSANQQEKVKVLISKPREDNCSPYVSQAL